MMLKRQNMVVLVQRRWPTFCLAQNIAKKSWLSKQTEIQIFGRPSAIDETTHLKLSHMHPPTFSPWGRESERIKIWKDEKKTTISKCLWHLLCNVRRFDERLQLRWFRVGNLVLFCIPETIDRNCDLQPSLCLLFFRLLRHRHPSVYNEYFAVPPGFQPSIRSVQQNHSRSGCHRTKYSFQAGCSGMQWNHGPNLHRIPIFLSLPLSFHVVNLPRAGGQKIKHAVGKCFFFKNDVMVCYFFLQTLFPTHTRYTPCALPRMLKWHQVWNKKWRGC